MVEKDTVISDAGGNILWAAFSEFQRTVKQTTGLTPPAEILFNFDEPSNLELCETYIKLLKQEDKISDYHQTAIRTRSPSDCDPRVQDQ